MQSVMTAFFHYIKLTSKGEVATALTNSNKKKRLQV